MNDIRCCRRGTSTLAWRSSLGPAILLLISCSRTPTLLIENWSGGPQQVHVIASHGATVFLRDTIEQGATLCWTVPAAARGPSLTIIIADVLDRDGPMFLDDGLLFHVPYLSDSLDLRRSWEIRIHVPRFFMGTPAWRALKERRSEAYYSDIRSERAIRTQLGERVDGAIEDDVSKLLRRGLLDQLERDEEAIREGRDMTESQADRFVTSVEMTPSRHCRAR